MKTRMACAALFLVVGVSGIATACGDMLPLPIPPVPVPISKMDLIRAASAGYSANAGYAAAMKKLDALGREAVGSSAWHANSYGGEFSYSVTMAGVTGVNAIYVEKSCNQDFIDNVVQTGAGGGGGSGISQDGCDSSPSYGIVGFTETSIPWSVCTPDGCTSGTYYEFEAQYGQIAGSC